MGFEVLFVAAQIVEREELWVKKEPSGERVEGEGKIKAEVETSGFTEGHWVRGMHSR